MHPHTFCSPADDAARPAPNRATLRTFAVLTVVACSSLLGGLSPAVYGPQTAFAADQTLQRTGAGATKTATPERRDAKQRGTAPEAPKSPPTATPTPTPTTTPTVTPTVPTPTPASESEPEVAAVEPTPEETPAAELDGPIDTAPDEMDERVDEPVAVEPEPPVAQAMAPKVARPAIGGQGSGGLSLHVLRYLPLILGASEEVGVDPAVLAALMEVEGSGEDAVSSAGAMGLMQLMPDKLLESDDPFDPGTNILRAAQLVRRLTWAWDGDLAAVAGAYFGAVAADGSITDDSDGISNGIQYVTRFAAAYERWAVALEQPIRPVAIRPKIRQRAAPPTNPTVSAWALRRIPDRDRWYLDYDGPRPAILPIYR